jgi:hypothetical protein
MRFQAFDEDIEKPTPLAIGSGTRGRYKVIAYNIT